MFLLIVIGCIAVIGILQAMEPEPVRDPEHDAKVEDY